MSGIILLSVIAALAAFAALFRRLATLERQVAALSEALADRRDATGRIATEPVAQPSRSPPPPTLVAPPPVDRAPPPNEPIPPAPRTAPPPRAPRPRPSFESVVGGKLPIWIGGAALVLAAFFLVRYSIELGLLGPAARTTIAALFGLALIAASEIAHRHRLVRDDPRVGQALAGAGVASLYGTLYVGAALYHLIGAGPAFLLMIAITLAALGLALRHGPPTAIMALIGGFAAPLIAGIDVAGIGPLLIYLALLVAALFGLAIRRSWAWLALAACGGGFLWVNILVALLDAGKLPGVGAFVLLLAAGATLALPATGTTRRWLRLAPLIAGLLQLVILAPALDFGALAWGFYLVLSAAALALAVRDESLTPGAGAALLLVIVMLGIGLDQPVTVTAPQAAIVATLLFGAVGHWRARRSQLWAAIALGGTAAPLLLAEVQRHALLAPVGWAALLVLAAACTASLSYRARTDARPTPTPNIALTGGATIAALLLGTAATELLPIPWRWPAWLALAVLLAAAARRTRDASLTYLALAPIAITALAMLAAADRLSGYLMSVVAAGATPPLVDLLAIGLLPTACVAATAWLLPDKRLHTGLTWLAWLLTLGLVTAILPAPWHAAGLALVAAAALALDLPLAIAALIAAAAAMLPQAVALLRLAAWSLAGDRLPYLLLPPLGTILRELTLPAALIAAALLWQPAMLARWRRIIWPVIAIVAVASVYALAKAPLAIATLPRFIDWGFTERAVITQLAFAAAWLLRTRQPLVSRGLFWLALGRIFWFDLLLLDPLLVRQSVGALPVANVATIGAGLATLWISQRRTDPRWYRAALAALLVTVLVTARQLTHGAILTGPVGRTENWLYSAALLALSLVWLWRGITTAAHDLRIAGLTLLTLVTLKVFLIDAAALEGVLRILSFLGLGIALIGIGWAYGRMMHGTEAQADAEPSA